MLINNYLYRVEKPPLNLLKSIYINCSINLYYNIVEVI